MLNFRAAADFLGLLTSVTLAASPGCLTVLFPLQMLPALLKNHIACTQHFLLCLSLKIGTKFPLYCNQSA
jgi:hypothetical protein